MPGCHEGSSSSTTVSVQHWGPLQHAGRGAVTEGAAPVELLHAVDPLLQHQLALAVHVVRRHAAHALRPRRLQRARHVIA